MAEPVHRMTLMSSASNTGHVVDPTTVNPSRNNDEYTEQLGL